MDRNFTRPSCFLLINASVYIIVTNTIMSVKVPTRVHINLGKTRLEKLKLTNETYPVGIVVNEKAQIVVH